MAEEGPGKGGGGGSGEDPAKSTEQEERTRAQILSGSGFCKWFNVRMGFGFISMTNSEGSPVDPPLDVFVHQSKLVMEGFRSLKEGEQVEFTYKKSSKGLESLRVTGPGGGPCAGSERRPKGKVPLQKRKPKGDRTLMGDKLKTVTGSHVELLENTWCLESCYNCGGLDHHAKECGLPPQPKKCHYCQSITHMVAQCPHKALAPVVGSQDQQASTSASAPGTGSHLCLPEEEERTGSSPLEGSSSSPEEPHTHRSSWAQRWRKS